MVLLTFAIVSAAAAQPPTAVPPPIAPVPAQGRGAAPPPPAPKPIVPIKVDIVLMRFQGEKKVSSLPFSVWVNANEPRYPGQPPSSGLRVTSLRMGVDVPAGQVSTTNSQGVTTTQPNYRAVGTKIDVSAEEMEPGVFSLFVSIEDSAIFAADPSGKVSLAASDPAAFRTFNTNNRITVKPGPPVQFTTAADMITGEVVRIEVAVSVLK
jgi:hypothetical protein